MNPCIKCGSTRRSTKNGACLDCKRAWNKAHKTTRRKDKPYQPSESTKAKKALWHKLNATRKKAMTIAWREANAMRVKEATARRYKAWKEANPERVRAHKVNRRARETGAKGFHTEVQWLDLLASYHGKCVYCGANATARDHVTPITKGGTDDISNIAPVCMTCNSSKGAKQLLVWLLKRPPRTRPT